MVEIVSGPCREQLPQRDDAELRVRSAAIEIALGQLERGQIAEVLLSERSELVEKARERASPGQIELRKAIEFVERTGLTVLENDLRARHPVGVLAMNQVPHHVVRAPRLATFIRGNPPFRKAAQHGIERRRRPGEDRYGFVHDERPARSVCSCRHRRHYTNPGRSARRTVGAKGMEHTRSVITSHGELCYTVAGRGPAVVAIQGVGVAGRGWQPQVDGLADRFTFVTFDHRGIGRSPRGVHPLSIEGMARDALSVAEAEGLTRFHVIGHSLGGLVAQHVALTARDRVQSLTLMCTFANGAHATRPSARMLLPGLRTRIGTRAMRRRGMVRLVMPPAYLRDRDSRLVATELEALFGRDLADQPPIISEQLRAMSRYSAVARLPELAGLPTLVLSATHDPIAPPRRGKEIASLIRGARFVEFGEAGHALPIQCAAEVNALLVDHLTQAQRGR